MSRASGRMNGSLRWKWFAGFVGILMIAAVASLSNAWAQNSTPGRDNILFIQQDQVQKFEIDWGHFTVLGYQIGTATGKISGTTLVDFTAQLTSPVPLAPNLLFVNEVTITDIDGDQVYFHNEGTGLFHTGLFGDTGFAGTGGTLSGTYVVAGGTGKYLPWRVGSKYQYRAVATNPPPVPNIGEQPTRLGTVYVEVYSNPVK